MRSPDRIPEVLALVEKIWQKHPDWRLGQLIENVASWANQSAWDIEEEQLAATIEQHLSQLREPLETDG